MRKKKWNALDRKEEIHIGTTTEILFLFYCNIITLNDASAANAHPPWGIVANGNGTIYDGCHGPDDAKLLFLELFIDVFENKE